MRRKFLKLK